MKYVLRAALVSLALSLAAPVAAADMAAGREAYQREDYAAAFSEWRPLAERGNAEAQTNLGVLHYQGQGVARDRVEAAKWYLKAASQGHAQAQTNLGVMYYHGQGVAQDYGKSLKWYRKAAEQGRAGAQAMLGIIYANGLGVTEDYIQAHMWWSLAASQGHDGARKNRDIVAGVMTSAEIGEAQKLARDWGPDTAKIRVASASAAEDFAVGLEAYKNGDYAAALGKFQPLAEQGHAEAQFNLGLMYVNGQGVTQDHSEAVEWYRKAAQQELAGAQYNLGLMYDLGHGVEQDFVLAVWWTLSARKGHSGAAKNRGIVEGGMSDLQLAQAQKLVREWKSK